MQKKHINKIICAVAMTVTMVFSMTGCEAKNKNAKVKLDPNNPVSITIWHYYNGTQQASFDALVEEFNATVGKEQGIFVKGSSYGSVSDLEKAIHSSLEGEVGASELPSIFSSYADTAYTAQKQGKLIDLTKYFTKEELDTYVDTYVQEGYFNQDGALYLLPVAKSTEVMIINKTDWEPFAKETGCTLEDLSTIEGVVEVSKKYYEWTDAKTPGIANDGKAFYGRDSMSNYFVIGMRQMGKEIFDAQKDGSVVLNLDKELIRRLWDNYYVPYMNGYFASYGKFRSDDVKTGDILAYTGSTSSSFYFPDNVETESGAYPIDFQVITAPIMEGGEKIMVQQGAGMAIVKSDSQHEYASSVFLKWFTEKEHNLRFVCDSAYMPVLKDANTIESIDKVISDNNIQMNKKVYGCLECVMNQFDSIKFYASRNFENGYPARKVLDYNLSDKADADKAELNDAIANGANREEELSKYISDESFEAWYQEFTEVLKQAAGVN